VGNYIGQCFTISFGVECTDVIKGASVRRLAHSWTELEQHLESAEERSISPANVNRLTPKWVFTTGGDVSATPTVADDAVYFPDWGGNLFAVRKKSGRLIWSHKISDYDGIGGSISRVSPAVDDDRLIIGDTLSESALHNGANVIAVDRHTGELRWITQVDSQGQAIITGSRLSLTALFTSESHRTKRRWLKIPRTHVARFAAA